MGTAAVAQVALPAVWLGAVTSISFLEAPLKFRAPGVTVPIGVGIGRLVFTALNRVELLLATAFLVAAARGPAPGTGGWTCAAALVVVLLAQTAWLRPRMDRRARALLAGHRTGRSSLHKVYVGLEAAKAALLVVTVLTLGASAA